MASSICGSTLLISSSLAEAEPPVVIKAMRSGLKVSGKGPKFAVLFRLGQ